jgi:oligosaccharide repeat unit polymerase
MPEGLLVAGLFVLAAICLHCLPPFHPAQLWTLPWLFTAALYALKLVPYKPLRWDTATVIVGAGVVFAGSAWVAGRGPSPGHPEPARGVGARHYVVARRTAWLLLALTAAWLGAFLVQVVSQYGIRAALISDVDVRSGVQAGEYALTIKFVYGAMAAAMACALAAAACPIRERRLLWLALGLLPISSVYFSTGRSNFVTASVMAAVVYLMSRPVRPDFPRTAAAVVAGIGLFVGTLYAGGALIGKTYGASELGTIDTVFYRTPAWRPLALPYQYVTAPIASLNELVPSAERWGATAGCATFATGCSVASAAGLPADPVPAIRVFTAPPLEWNTYTALDAPLLDAGPVLGMLIVGLLGALTGFVWRRACRGDPVFVAAYGGLGTAALSSVIQNNFFAPHYIGAILLFGLAWQVGASLINGARRRGIRDAEFGSPLPSNGPIRRIRARLGL